MRKRKMNTKYFLVCSSLKEAVKYAEKNGISLEDVVAVGGIINDMKRHMIACYSTWPCEIHIADGEGQGLYISTAFAHKE